MKIKVFKSLKEKIGNLKLVKKAKYLVLAVSLVATLTACGINKDFFSSQPSSSPYSTTMSTENPSSEWGSSSSNDLTGTYTEAPTMGDIQRVTLDAELQQIIDANVSFSSSSNAAMQSAINGINVNYEHSEYFGVDSALSMYNSMPDYTAPNSSIFIVNGRIDSARLKGQILENNRMYREEATSSRYTEFSSSDFDKIYSAFIETLQGRIDAGVVDLNSLDEKLQGMILLQTKDYAFGFVSAESNLLAINLDGVAAGQSSNPGVDYLKATVMHEAIHYLQIPSIAEEARRGFDDNLGVSYTWGSLAVNPLFATWFYEGAAEHLMTVTYGNGQRPVLYKENVKGIEAMTLATILGEGNTPTTVSDVTLQKDLNELFKLFNATTKDQKDEVIKMIFANEINLNGSREFFASYGRSMGGNEEAMFKFGLRASMAQTLAKNFYTNLANSITSKTVKLEEIFMLISVYESDMNRMTRYGDSSRLTVNMDLLENYIFIQNEFFSLLARETHIDFDQIVRAYNAYNANANASTVNITFLDGNTNSYWRKAAAELDGDRTHSINSVYASVNQNNQIK